MKYIDFYNKFKDYPIIHLSDIKNIESDFDHRRLYEWQKKGYLKKIINNFYVFQDKNLSDVEINFIANKLHEPSYLSLEYALNYYNLIPEIVFLHTCISTKRTKNIKTDIGNFSYHTVKKDLFFGYKLVFQNNLTYKIAEIEKALLDFFYFRKDILDENAIRELRINKDIFKKKVNQKKLMKYLKVFNSKKMEEKIKLLNNYVKY
jgi:predicted transcriptional regulator of viral defense system